MPNKSVAACQHSVHHELQAFAALQRMLDPTLDHLMTHDKTFRHAEPTEQLARELKGYLSKSLSV